MILCSVGTAHTSQGRVSLLIAFNFKIPVSFDALSLFKPIILQPISWLPNYYIVPKYLVQVNIALNILAFSAFISLGSISSDPRNF